jgi:outer membrane protein TolC
VKTSLMRWNQSQQLSARTIAIMSPVREQAARMERLFTAGQTDLVKLLQVRQRWLDSANAQLDAARQATQSYADLFASVGGVPCWAPCPSSKDVEWAVSSPGETRQNRQLRRRW